MKPCEHAREAMAEVLASDPFASITAMVDAAIKCIHGCDLDRPWLEDLAFEVSETDETCF